MFLRLGNVLPAAFGIGLFFVWQRLFAVPPLPIIEDKWWGPGEPSDVGSEIRPFKIRISDEAFRNLSTKLDLWQSATPPLEGVAFNYGFNNSYLTEIVKYWREVYDWQGVREEYLNSLPQFKTYISGLDLHYIHVKPEDVPQGTKILPLLLLHGWPGSVREFYKVIPLLTTPRQGRNFVFEVIVPSLPGYGFSQGAAKPGFGPAQMSLVLKKLMTRIGHDRFYVQGGDWGGTLSAILATLYPDVILGVHSNLCTVLSPLAELTKLVCSIYPPILVEEQYQDRIYPLGAKYSLYILETGYFHIQATKPDTVGAALTDSPAGLAAYILEKFSSATNGAYKQLPDGGLTKKFNLDDLLDNVMIYYISNSMTTAARLYAEGFSPAHFALGIEKIPTNVPYTCSHFPNDILYTPPAILKMKFRNLVHNSHPPVGGHFAAFEEPVLFADEVFEGISKILEKSTPKNNQWAHQ